MSERPHLQLDLTYSDYTESQLLDLASATRSALYSILAAKFPEQIESLCSICILVSGIMWLGFLTLCVHFFRAGVHPIDAPPPPTLAQDGLVTAGSINVGTTYKTDLVFASALEVWRCSIPRSLPHCVKLLQWLLLQRCLALNTLPIAYPCRITSQAHQHLCS